MTSSIILLLLIVIFSNTNAFVRQMNRNANTVRNTLSMALKYDPTDFITVNVKKPLGLSLEEIVVNEARGVYVSEVNEGSAKATNKVYKGLILLSVNGQDVKYKDFDSVMDMLINAPATNPLELVFIDNRKVEKGPATVSVNLSDGRKITIETVKGQMLRPLLLNAGVELYQGKAKLTNCGGGGSCGTCVVGVIANKDWENRPDFEALRLKKYDETARLSCNTVIESDCTVICGLQKTK